MMTKRMTGTGARIAALALSSTAAMALAACQEHAYPSAAPREATTAPASDDAALAGAPTTRSPEYVPPAGSPAPAYPPSYPPARGYGPPPPAYARPAPGNGPPVVISMAPIPNPPETPRREGPRHRRHHRIHARLGYGAPVYGSAPYPHHHHRRRTASPWVFHPYATLHPHHHHHHHHLAAAPHGAAPKPQASSPVGAPPARQLPKPSAVVHHHRHGAATAAAASSGANTTATSSNAVGSNTVNSSSEADRYQALQQGLRTLFARGARLQSPAHMEAGQPVVVSLTLPADFAQSAEAEAAKDGLNQASRSLNLTATLTGDGYTVTPSDAQSQPLTQNTVTMFEWKVTPTGAAHGPLQAAVKAQPVGDNHTLDLGAKSTDSGASAGRIVGVGLLAVLAVGLLAWAAQRRPTKSRSSMKPRANHTNGTPSI